MLLATTLQGFNITKLQQLATVDIMNKFTQGTNIYVKTQEMLQPCELLATGISAMDTSLFATTLQAGGN